MFLFDFFNKSSRNSVEPAEKTIDKTLFLDENEPPQEEESAVCESPLAIFMKIDFSTAGFHDGYLFPNAEMLEANMRRLNADFRVAVDKVIDQKRSEVNQMKLHLINIKGIADKLEEGLSHKISEVLNLIHELDTQKLLSVESEGWIAGPLNQYKSGFIKGVERFNQEKWFASTTGLF